MKKIMCFVMLLLTTSMAMAQFGDLDEIIRKAESGNSGGYNDEKPDAPCFPGAGSGVLSANPQIIEEAVKNGFFLIRQDYQLEDKNEPGSRYNRGDAPSFGYGISFLVRLSDGFVTLSRIVTPWLEDEHFPKYENSYNPVFSKTSTLKVGQKEWKTENKVFQPKAESDLGNGLQLVKDAEWTGGGFAHATGYGKKEVLVVWLVADGNLADAKSVRLSIDRMELNIAKGLNSLDVEVPANPNIKNAVGGIVLEPLYKGIGRIELALVGVINTNNALAGQGENASGNRSFNVSLLVTDDVDDVKSSDSLAPVEKPKADKKSSKKSSSKQKQQ